MSFQCRRILALLLIFCLLSGSAQAGLAGTPTPRQPAASVWTAQALAVASTASRISIVHAFFCRVIDRVRVGAHPLSPLSVSHDLPLDVPAGSFNSGLWRVLSLGLGGALLITFFQLGYLQVARTLDIRTYQQVLPLSLGALLLSSFAQELFARFFVFGALKVFIRTSVANLLQAALFTAWHYIPGMSAEHSMSLIPAFMIDGLIYGRVFHRAGDQESVASGVVVGLAASTVAHGIVNVLAQISKVDSGRFWPSVILVSLLEGASLLVWSRSRRRSLSSEAGQGPAREPHGNIIGPAVTHYQELDLRKAIARNSNKVRDANLNMVRLVEAVCSDLLFQRESELAKALQDLRVPEWQVGMVLRKLRHPTSSFQWFDAVVRGPEWYMVGHEGALAVDVLRTLMAAENQGPDQHLMAEYILHEAMENMNLTHDQIIRFTSAFFRRPGYTRSGDTPVGRVLRKFINNEAIVYWNYEIIRASTQERLKRRTPPSTVVPFQKEFRVNADGKMDRAGFFLVALEWTKAGKLRIRRTEEIRIENGIERHFPFAGALPENLQRAIARYNDDVTKDPLRAAGITAQDIQYAKDLMRAQPGQNRDERYATVLAWTELVSDKPLLLPTVLESLKQTPQEFLQAVRFLVDVYVGMWREPVDQFLGSLAGISPGTFRTMAKTIQQGIDELFFLRNRPWMSGHFFQNADDLGTQLDFLLHQAS